MIVIDLQREGIELSMEDYANSIKEIQEIRKVKKDKCLMDSELKLFRKYTGKINWLGGEYKTRCVYMVSEYVKVRFEGDY